MHGYIEHQRQRPQPFSASGDMEAIRKMFSMPEYASVEDFETALLSNEAKVFVPKNMTCNVTQWRCDTNFGASVYVIEATPVAMVQSDYPSAGIVGDTLHIKRTPPTAKTDQWVVIGTTTIDGTPTHVGEAIDQAVGFAGEERRDAEDAIDAFMRSPDPWMIGGRMLRSKGVRTFNGATMIFCDIVRRQSEIDAEQATRTEAARQHFIAIKSNLPKAPCPECGPHGNRGRVLLMDREVACTVCAGGVSGDAFGTTVIDVEVNPDAEWHNAHNHGDVVVPGRTSFTSDALLGHQSGGFEVPTAAEVTNYMEAMRMGIVSRRDVFCQAIRF
jgi:hypothetical protein